MVGEIRTEKPKEWRVNVLAITNFRRWGLSQVNVTRNYYSHEKKYAPGVWDRIVFRNAWLKVTISNGKNWNLLHNFGLLQVTENTKARIRKTTSCCWITWGSLELKKYRLRRFILSFRAPPLRQRGKSTSQGNGSTLKSRTVCYQRKQISLTCLSRCQLDYCEAIQSKKKINISV